MSIVCNFAIVTLFPGMPKALSFWAICQMQQETKCHVSDVIAIAKVTPKATLQFPCFSHVIVYYGSVIFATFSHGEDMCVGPLVYISPRRRNSHAVKSQTLLSLCLMKQGRKESDQK